MSVNRGSNSQFLAVAETTPGSTPTTPAMIEIPLVSFTPNLTNSVIRSDQIRSHPFQDKMLPGRPVHEFGIEFELGTEHDILLETMFGGSLVSGTMKMADTLKTLTLEERVASGDFNQFTYSYLSSMSVTVSAGDGAPIKVSMTGMARTAALDAAATVAGSVVPSANEDPFTFVGATLQIENVSVPVASATINVDRAVDPLMLLGGNLPRDFIPSAISVTGTITVPYDDAGSASGQSIQTIATGFSNAILSFKFSNESGSDFRTFLIPAAKFISLGRPMSDRGMRMQEINFEGIFSAVDGTAITLSKGGGANVLRSAINGAVLTSAINGQPLTSARSA